MLRPVILLLFSYLIAAGATTCSQLKTIYSDYTCCDNSNVDTCLRTIPLCTDPGVSNGNICSSSSDTTVVKGGISDYILPIASTSTLGGVKVDGSSVTVSNGVISADTFDGNYDSLTNKPTLFSGSYDDLTNQPTLFNGDYNSLSNAPTPYSLPVASATVSGGVKVDGSTVVMDNGVLKVYPDYLLQSDLPAPYSLPTASTTALGGVKVDGTTITISDGVITSSQIGSIATASPTVLGGVKVDNTTITISNGVITAHSSDDGVTSYNDLTDKPTLFSGNYADLNDKPAAYTLPAASTTTLGGVKVDDLTITISNGMISAPKSSVSYNDLDDKPTLFSGSYGDLTNKPALFSGRYGDLTNQPNLFSGSYNDLTHKPDLFSKSYNDLTDHPSLFTGSYVDLTNKPNLFSGNYNDLSHKPAIPTAFSGNYNDLSNKPTIPTAFSGSYVDLTNKPTLFSGNYADLNDKPTPYSLPVASTTVSGGVKVDGSTVVMDNGVLKVYPDYLLPSDLPAPYTLPNTLDTLSNVLQVTSTNNIGLGIAPGAPFHVGTGVSTTVSASRFECDGTAGEVVEQTSGTVTNIMATADCSALPNFESGVPATTATKSADALCQSGDNYKVYGSQYVQLPSGDSSVNKLQHSQECSEYARKSGCTYTTGISSSDPNGCLHKTSPDGTTCSVYFNTDTTSVDCGVNDYKCVKKLNVKDLSSGQPPFDVRLTEEECEAYASSISGSTWGTDSGTDRPNGCYHAGLDYRFATNGNLACGAGSHICVVKDTAYDNPGGACSDTNKGSSTTCVDTCYDYNTASSKVFSGSICSDIADCEQKCTDDLTCAGYTSQCSVTGKTTEDTCGTCSNIMEVASGAPDGSVSEAECETQSQYTVLNDVWGTLTPLGCFRHSNGNAYYNSGTSGGNCEGYGSYKCIQKQQVFEVVQVTSGAPDLSVSEAECEAHRGSGWSSPTYTNGRPRGCYNSGGAVYYNHETTSTVDCSASVPCLQKAAAKTQLTCGTCSDSTKTSPTTCVSECSNAAFTTQATCGTCDDTSKLNDGTCVDTCYDYSSSSKVFSGTSCSSLADCENKCSNDLTCAGHTAACDFTDKTTEDTCGTCTSSVLVEVTSGAPDGSVSQAECEQVTLGNGYMSTLAWSTYPNGCIDNGAGYIYYNTGVGNCGASGSKCIQKQNQQVNGEKTQLTCGTCSDSTKTSSTTCTSACYDYSSSSNVYSGASCTDVADCEQKCADDLTCAGYTRSCSESSKAGTEADCGVCNVASLSIEDCINFEQISQSISGHSCAVLGGGTLKCWGLNNEGQLGYGDTNNRGGYSNQMGSNLLTVNLGTGRTAKQVASEGSSFTCAILDDDTLKCWGHGYYGNLGYGNEYDQTSPPSTVVNLGTGKTAKQVSVGGDFTCAILNDDTLKCWGRADYYQLGNGNKYQNKNTPQAVDLGTGKTAKQISLGDRHGCAILNDDTVKCWGGTSPSYGSTPSAMNLGTGKTAKQLSSGGGHTCVILNDDTVKCWGQNGNGQLGVGSTSTESTPKAVNLGTGKTAKQIACGATHTCAIYNDDTVKCWGGNDYGELGYGNTIQRNNPTATSATVNLGTGKTATQISCGGYYTCAILNDDTLKCWGQNLYGKLGLGIGGGTYNSANDRKTPQTTDVVDTNRVWTAYSLSYAYGSQSANSGGTSQVRSEYPEYFEVNSGNAAAEGSAGYVSRTECGHTTTVNWSTDPSGCIKQMDNGIVRWNENINTYHCSVFYGCIQKTTQATCGTCDDTNKLNDGTCVDTCYDYTDSSKIFGSTSCSSEDDCRDKCTDSQSCEGFTITCSLNLATYDGTQETCGTCSDSTFYSSTTCVSVYNLNDESRWAPMSITSAAECQAYADATPGSTWIGTIDENTNPKGCIRANGGNTYFNIDDDTWGGRDPCGCGGYGCPRYYDCVEVVTTRTWTSTALSYVYGDETASSGGTSQVRREIPCNTCYDYSASSKVFSGTQCSGIGDCEQKCTDDSTCAGYTAACSLTDRTTEATCGTCSDDTKTSSTTCVSGCSNAAFTTQATCGTCDDTSKLNDGTCVDTCYDYSSSSKVFSGTSCSSLADCEQKCTDDSTCAGHTARCSLTDKTTLETCGTCVGDTTKSTSATCVDTCYDYSASSKVFGNNACSSEDDCTNKCTDLESCAGWTASCSDATTAATEADCVTGCGVAGISEDSCKNVFQITAKNEHYCAILAEGVLKCWGKGDSGKLGIGSTSDQTTPQTVNLGTGMTAKQVSVGWDHTCAILNDDTLKCWGEGDYGRLGIGSTTDYSTPQAVDLGSGKKAKQVAAGGEFTCVILTDDTVKCWGQTPGLSGTWLFSVVTSGAPDESVSEAECQAYRGSGWPSPTYNSARPRGCYNSGGAVYYNHETTSIGCTASVPCIQKQYHYLEVVTSEAPDESVSEAECEAYADATDGLTWKSSSSWDHFHKGCSVYGNGNVYFNNDDTTHNCGVESHNCIQKLEGYMTTPQTVSGITAKYIDVGKEFVCVIDLNNYLYCWGRHDDGYRGLGGTNASSPTKITVTSSDLQVKQITIGGTHQCIVMMNDRVRCWGRNDYGQIAVSVSDNYEEVESGPPLADTHENYVGLSECQSVDNSRYQSEKNLADKPKGCYRVSGYYYFNTHATSTTQCSEGYHGNKCIQKVQHSKSPPDSDMTMLFGNTVLSIACGDTHCSAVKTNNKVEVWGNNDNNQMGVSSSYTPDGYFDYAWGNYILGTTNTQVAAGHDSICVITDNGAIIKCWGRIYDSTTWESPQTQDDGVDGYLWTSRTLSRAYGDETASSGGTSQVRTVASSCSGLPASQIVERSWDAGTWVNIGSPFAYGPETASSGGTSQVRSEASSCSGVPASRRIDRTWTPLTWTPRGWTAATWNSDLGYAYAYGPETASSGGASQERSAATTCSSSRTFERTWTPLAWSQLTWTADDWTTGTWNSDLGFPYAYGPETASSGGTSQERSDGTCSEFTEVTSGAPDGSVSEAECEAYGLSMGDSDGLTSLTNNYPVGCFKRTSGYFWSSGTDGTLCSTSNVCIQKLAAPASRTFERTWTPLTWTQRDWSAFDWEAGAWDSDLPSLFVYGPETASSGGSSEQRTSTTCSATTSDAHRFERTWTVDTVQATNACRDACSNPSQAILSGTHGFTPASFTVEVYGGECTCHSDSTSTCQLEANNEVDLYALNWAPKGCFKDTSTGKHYHNTNEGGPCSDHFLCLRNDGRCLVQDNTNEVKQLSMIVEKSAWFKQEVVVSSDRRIKENIVDVEDAREKMRLISARSYSYIDKRKHSGTTVGFIAQEVKEVMPEAVKVEKGFVPNLLKRVTCTYKRDVTLTMSCAELATGRVRLFVTDGEDGENLLDVDVTDGVIEVEKVYTQVYAFGYEVEDFHTLEKSKLFSLNFAATKELDREVQLLREEIDAMKQAAGN